MSGEMSIEEGIQARAKALVDEWERLEGESMREGHRATLERLIAAEFAVPAPTPGCIPCRKGEDHLEGIAYPCQSVPGPTPGARPEPPKDFSLGQAWVSKVTGPCQACEHAQCCKELNLDHECWCSAADLKHECESAPAPARVDEPDYGCEYPERCPGHPARVEPVRCPSCGEILGAWKHFNCAPVPPEPSR